MARVEPLIDLEMRSKPERIRTHLELVHDWEAMVVEAQYSARELAKRCGFSVRHLQRFILRRYRKSLGDFIAGIRLQKAYLLLQSGFSIKETALGLGYKQVSHFCRCFKRRFGANASCVLGTCGRMGDDRRSDQQLQLELFQPRQPVLRKTTRRRAPVRRSR